MRHSRVDTHRGARARDRRLRRPARGEVADGELTVDHIEQFGRRVAVRRGAGARRDFDLYKFEVRARKARKRTLGAGKATRLPAFKAGNRPAIRIATARHYVANLWRHRNAARNAPRALQWPGAAARAHEFKLLRHMLEDPEKVFSRDELIEAAWPGNVYVGPRTVDVHISRLRKSSGSHPIAIPSEPSGSVGMLWRAARFDAFKRSDRR